MASEPVDKSMMVMDKADIHVRYIPGRDAPYILSIIKRYGPGVSFGDARVNVALSGGELYRLCELLDPRLIEAESTMNVLQKKLREAVIAKEKAEAALLDAKAKPERAQRNLVVKTASGSILFSDATDVWEDKERHTLVVKDADDMTLAEFARYEYWTWTD